MPSSEGGVVGPRLGGCTGCRGLPAFCAVLDGFFEAAVVVECADWL